MTNIDTKLEVARVSVAAVGVTVWGVTLNEWVALVTLVYLAVQIVILMPRAVATIKNMVKR